MIMHRRDGPPPHVTKFIVNRLDRQLDLTDEQRTKIEAILDRRHERIRAIMEQTHPRVRAEVEQTNAEIEAILTPEQRVKFEKLKMRLMMRRHVGPPPHPPHTH
jgi:Spy/CpxP family protein refolding chaperone